MGVVRLIPTARFVPMRLHCVQLLQQVLQYFSWWCTFSLSFDASLKLADSSGGYIPSCALLLDVLKFNELTKKPKASTQAPPNLAYCMKIPPSAWSTRVTQVRYFPRRCCCYRSRVFFCGVGSRDQHHFRVVET